MSDFDKEAEREKLREKYERDQEKRQSTQRMSELLLKGATMTNRHCEECGNPIFRYDGQEFCPTCQHAAQQGTAETAAGSGTETSDGTGAEVSADEATAEANGASEAASPDAEISEGASRGEEPLDGAGDGTERVRNETGRVRNETGRVRNEALSTGGDGSRSDTESVERDGDLTAARASLVRSVERFARAAERTDDPRRARDHLAAAREAAEALAALDR